jgi:LemA protein
MGIGGWMFVAVIAMAIAWVVTMYGVLVSLRNQFWKAFSHIDVQLRRRYDLIPNLVETAKGYIAHERETLDAVIAARASAVQAAQRAAVAPGAVQTMRDLAQAEAELAGALGRLLLVVEAFPRLKANENMLALQDELTSTENRIAFTRQSYNDAVLDYNIRRERFPASLLAIVLAFAPAASLPATQSAGERTPQRVALR